MKQPKDGKAEQPLAAFPAYDAKKVPGAKSTPAAPPELLTVVATSTNQDSLVRNMQRVLNTARKAEGKVTRLREDRAEKVKMWEAWEQQLKQAYLTEGKRHQQNLDTLDRELSMALAAQERAREDVRRAADPSAQQ